VKTLLCIRSDYKSNPAGDTTLLKQTSDYLQERGMEVTVNCGQIQDYSDYDIVHLFNLTRISETYEFFWRARQQKKPLVITPIYWDLSEFYRGSKNADALRRWEAYAPFRQEILDGCAAIYPSSNLEKERIGGEYGASLPQVVVYSGIDSRRFPDSVPMETEDYILCAARVCPRKNQLALVKAAHRLGVRLILAGKANNRDYLDRCLAFQNVQYEGFLPFQKLLPLYLNARLHVLCGFVETPGLANLEAAACGCKILSTAEGSAAEYFEDMALYCNPYDEQDLYEKVEAGLTRKRQPHLRAHVLKNFSLNHCMEPLYLSYCSLGVR
jgi:glycosyltransferase involved in cell wall biosynthesis